MAMLLDGPPSAIEDLTLRDSDLLNVSASEGIDLTAKLELASRDLRTTLESLLLSAQPFCLDITQAFPSLRNISVTPHLKLWHTYSTLRLVYQDLYFSRLNDRYQAKMKLYQGEEKRALDDTRVNGFGIVLDPLPQAVAPGIDMVSSSGAGGTLYVAIAYINRKGEEGLVSVPIEVDIQDGNAAVTRLIALADHAVGWNLYAGLTPDTLALQNTEILDALDTATISPDNLRSGPKPGNGQSANFLFPIPKRILRG